MKIFLVPFIIFLLCPSGSIEVFFPSQLHYAFLEQVHVGWEVGTSVLNLSAILLNKKKKEKVNLKGIFTSNKKKNW